MDASPGSCGGVAGQVELPFVIEGGDELIAAMRRLVARLQQSLPG